MNGKRSSRSARDYRIVRACFAAFFLALFLWVLSNYELSGWPFLILVLSAISVVINAAQAIAGPSSSEDSAKKGPAA
jgi:hypothetical protein